jgi:hypothetical protein
MNKPKINLAEKFRLAKKTKSKSKIKDKIKNKKYMVRNFEIKITPLSTGELIKPSIAPSSVSILIISIAGKNDEKIKTTHIIVMLFWFPGIANDRKTEHTNPKQLVQKKKFLSKKKQNIFFEKQKSQINLLFKHSLRKSGEILFCYEFCCS